MESSGSEGQDNGRDNVRMPLSEVVSDCVKRWFKDTLKEAKAGDVNMQILVGQMYYNGYGVPKDAQKGRFWMTKASRIRSSVWKVSDKRPGYNASDSDSDELKVTHGESAGELTRIGRTALEPSAMANECNKQQDVN